MITYRLPRKKNMMWQSKLARKDDTIGAVLATKEEAHMLEADEVVPW